MLGAFLRAVESGIIEQGSFLLVENLDRISRTTPHKAIKIIERICEAGISLVTLSDGKVYTDAELRKDPIGMLMAHVTFIRANQESAAKSDRALNNWDIKRKNADTTVMTKLCPAWLSVENKKFVVIPERAELVREMFELSLEGKGQNAIIAMVNERGVAPWDTGKRKGVRWHRTYVSHILGNAAVIGEFTPKRKGSKTKLDTLKSYYPAIVTPELFYGVQELRQGARLKGLNSELPCRNIAARLTVCPYCGGGMSRVTKGGGYEYLVCSKGKSGAGCSSKYIRLDRYEAALLQGLTSTHGIPYRADISDKLRSEIDEYKGRLALAEAEITNIVEALADGRGKEEDYLITLTDHDTGAVPYRLVDEIRRREASINSIKSEIDRLQALQYVATADNVLSMIQELQVASGGEDKGRINKVLLKLCKKIVLSYAEGRIVVHFNHSATVREIPFTGYEMEFTEEADEVVN